MSKVIGKDRLLLYTIRSTYSTFKFDTGAECERFREFAHVCNLAKYSLKGRAPYLNAPGIDTIKKYFKHFLDKTDYENKFDVFKELHTKLCVKLQTFCRPGVECIRGLILFLAYDVGLLKTFDELFEAAKYLNEKSQWKIEFREFPDVPEATIFANLANEELMLYTIIGFAYQTYRVSLKYSEMERSFDYFVRNICQIDRDYCYTPCSSNVPSFRTIRKTFEDYHPLHSSRTGPERTIRAYKMIEKENKKGCKAAVHGLVLFLAYYDGLLKTYEEVFDVALALTKYTRPVQATEEEDREVDVLADFDINNFIDGLRIPQAAPAEDVKHPDIKTEVFNDDELDMSDEDVKPDMPDIKTEVMDDELEISDVKTEVADDDEVDASDVKAEVVDDDDTQTAELENFLSRLQEYENDEELEMSEITEVCVTVGAPLDMSLLSGL